MGWGGGGNGMYQVMQMMMKMKGKGKGKGGGKGRNFPADKKVWIGNLPESVKYKELFELFKESGAKWVEVFGGNVKGTGMAAFKTSEEATAAISKFNGHVLSGNMIQVDVWTKKEKE
eukprot:gnl/MRDRNA2_/MRDRNA2_32483_c0_seq1.p2 gnl/MRDRNA2_/MRDRNA2_32483_c0~~gnl/MRDRNA2_/MRDRNA2_32483_c0_seq1.p2  ORF type:complete len:117 (+),score=40.19 gnl/MRDRNA2_/MRDRNA2_32483_c0_seq1:101-451(+)